MKRIKTQIIAMLSITLLAGACKKDKDPVPAPPPVTNDGEVITTLKLTFTDSASTTDVRYASFNDADGNGGNAPLIDSIKLAPDKTWLTTVLLLNETVTPADTISNVVLAEAVDHIFCFTPAGTTATVTITDLDANNKPLGLQSKWKTGVAGTGTMHVTLKHQPGVKDGTCSPGETDVEVTFPIKIQ